MSAPKPEPGLRADAIGLLGATTLGVVFLSPAMTLYGLFGPLFLAVGPAAPLAFVFALLATLPTAYSYAVLARDHEFGNQDVEQDLDDVEQVHHHRRAKAHLGPVPGHRLDLFAAGALAPLGYVDVRQLGLQESHGLQG